MKIENNNNLNRIRLFAGFCVVVMHLLFQGGILFNIVDRKVAYPFATIIYGLFFTCINLFGFLSGYLLYKKKSIKKRRIIDLLATTIFYSVIITIVFYYFNLHNVRNLPVDNWELKNYLLNGYSNLKTNPTLFICSLFPMLFSGYWYIVCYIFLYLCIPYLNAFINSVDEKKYKGLLIVLFVLLTIPQFVFPVDLFKISGGYSPFWLMYCYLIGAYIAIYRREKDYSRQKLLSISFICLVIETTLSVILNKYRINIMNIDYLSLRFLDYISPFNLILSICLFMLFLKRKDNNNRIINKIVELLGKTSLAVYIIHGHPLVFEYIVKDSVVFATNHTTITMILIVLGIAVLIYLACSIIELLRMFLVNVIKKLNPQKSID